MAVPGPVTGAKYGSHKRHFISQIIVVINKIFCSVFVEVEKYLGKIYICYIYFL